MIRIGNTTITAITIGSSSVQKIDWGTSQVWPDGGGSTYIALPYTGTSVTSTAGSSYLSNITASTTSWSVASDSTGWLTVTKTSNTQIRFTYTENGSTTARTGTLSFKIGNNTYATYEVKQYGSNVYIVLNPTTVQPWNGWSRSGTISVSSNTTSWSVDASSAPTSATPYFRVSKTNNTTITWIMDENFGTSSRIGYIYVTAGAVQENAYVYQNAGYYIYIEGGNSPRSVASGSGSISISVISNYGNTPVPVYSASSNSWLTCTNMVNAGSGKYVYTFSFPANPNSYSRSSVLTFQQQSSDKYTSINVTQWAKYVPATISGFTRSSLTGATYGDWQVGTYIGSYANIQGQQVPIKNLAILKVSPVTSNYSANFNITYTTRSTSATTATTITGPRSISTTSTVSIPSGDTAYGIVLTAGPNLFITNISNFTVT